MLPSDIWERTDPLARLLIGALTPVGQLYGATVEWKARYVTPERVGVPVVCIGNLTAGGTGKTPLAIAAARALAARGRRPFFLSRGYGGSARGPLQVAPEQRAADVGDEPLLLAQAGPAIVARDRREGARLAIERGAGSIVMDDGHQNFALVKELSLVVVDAEQGFGNGRILPAGPLREPVAQGLRRADAIVLMGDGNPPLAHYAGPVLRAHLEPEEPHLLAGRRVVAFAGIGRPNKFFRSLARLGAELLFAEPFADHHRYAPAEIGALKAKARAENAQLVTTEKDYVRLSGSERHGIAVLRVRAVFDDPAAFGRLLDRLPRPG